MNPNNKSLINRLNKIYNESYLPRVDLRELKFIVHSYYHTPLTTLLDQDNEDKLQKDRAIQTDSSGIPTTAPTLKEKLLWREVSLVLEALKLKPGIYKELKVTGFETYILNHWVGIVDVDFITQLEDITGAENLKANPPKVDSIDTQNAVKELIKRLEKYL